MREQLDGKIGVQVPVLRKQDAPPFKARGRSIRRGQGYGIRRGAYPVRYEGGDFRPLTLSAFDADASSHLVDKVLHDGEVESCARSVADGRAALSGESVEGVLQTIGAHADARILHAGLDDAFIRSAHGELLGGEPYAAAFGRVFDGVAYQVDDDFRDMDGIHVEPLVGSTSEAV